VILVIPRAGWMMNNGWTWKIPQEQSEDEGGRWDGAPALMCGADWRAFVFVGSETRVGRRSPWRVCG